MKLRTAWLAILCIGLAAAPAWAGYDNGPINGTTDAWAINFGYVVSDTYVSDGTTFGAFLFATWEFPGDTLNSVQWSITSEENGGTLYGSGTASQVAPCALCASKGGTLTDRFISTNQYGYDIDLIAVSGLNVPQQSGATYWLNLQNASVPSGDPVYWDENSGAGCRSNGCPSKASESAVGTIASEAFTIASCGVDNSNSPDCGSSTSAPEPSSILLVGSGILGIVGVLRRKLNF